MSDTGEGLRAGLMGLLSRIIDSANCCNEDDILCALNDAFNLGHHSRDDELAELHGALHFAATNVYHQLVIDGEAVRYEAPNGEVTARASHNCESAAVAAAFLTATELAKASKAGA